MSAPDWIAYVIAYMQQAAYITAYTRWCVIGFLHAFYAFISTTLGKFLLGSR